MAGRACRDRSEAHASPGALVVLPLNSRRMGLLIFSLNVTLDGCVDHQEGIADDETHAYFTRLMDGLPATRRLELLSAEPLHNGAVAMHYRRTV